MNLTPDLLATVGTIFIGAIGAVVAWNTSQIKTLHETITVLQTENKRLRERVDELELENQRLRQRNDERKGNGW